MDNEEKRNTTPPQEKSGKRRKRKPAVEGGEVTAAAKQAAEPDTPPSEPEKKPENEPAQETLPSPEPETAAPTAETEPPAGSEAAGSEKKEEQEEQETRDHRDEPAEADGNAEPVPETGPQEETAPATPEETVRDTADLPQEPETEQTEASGTEQPEDNDPLPDGLSFTEEDLSDALDTMMAPGENTRKEKAPADETPPEESAEAEEKTAPAAPETPEPTEDAAEEPQEEENPAQEPEEEEKRLSDLTRTVQLSVEQIMARAEAEEGTQEEAAEHAEEEEEIPATLGDHVRSGVSGMCKWLLLVVFFVLVIAGAGVAWLYRSATPDLVPDIRVTFAGQTVQPAAYKWKVPVVGNLFKRTYAETFSSTPVELEASVDQISPDIQISPADYRTDLTVTDSADNTVFEGDVEEFASFQFDANGQYTAKLVVHIDQSTVSGAADVSGSETWLFSFTVGVRASVRLNSDSVTQGSVAAIRVGATMDGQPPEIETELENAGFFPAGVGWVCYLPIPWNQPARDYEITVAVSGQTETLSLTVREGDWEYKDYSRESQRTEPYINDANMPAQVKKLLADTDGEIAWTNSNFVQPFLRSLKVKLAYGTTEYVGRSYSERSSNTGTGGRTAVNTILSTTWGELLIAPANGTVVLAQDLGSGYGNTLVIDHGAGVKSIFYGLDELEVKTGDVLKQGQTLATCTNTTVAELRIGNVPVDPLPIWRGQCDALKYY